MSRGSGDRALAAMAAANPVPVEELRAELGEAALSAALAEAMEQAQGPIVLQRRLKPGRRILVGAGAGLAALAVAILITLGVPGRGNSGQAFAASAVRVAEANPRLLVEAPGWKVTRADGFAPDSGEITFSDGTHRLEVHWYPARLYRSYRRDRASVSRPVAGALLGHPTTTVRYSRSEYATMLAPQGRVFLEIRGNLGDRAGYRQILASLHPVDVETWLEAMPASVVRPGARVATVARMLRGVALPDGFDASAVATSSGASVSDRYSLQVQVAGAVACGWVHQWIRATEKGDAVAAAEAVGAMSGSARWPIVRRMNASHPGGWDENLRTISRQLEAGRLNRGPAGYEVTASGRSFAYGPAYAFSLGCGGTYRRAIASAPH
jgi:hypothetical protein